MMAGIGHNSAHFDEEFREEVETVLSDDHKAIFHYAQWHIGDYIEGTNGMQLEAEGAYIRFLMRLYRRGKPLPDNDAFMATTMGLTTRVWRRIRQVLIEFGKIIARNGCLTNSRFEKERQKRAEEMQKRAAAANARWQKRAEANRDLPNETVMQSESNVNATAMFQENSGKKTNKINEPVLHLHMLTNNQYPITIDNNPPIVPPGGDGAPKRRKNPVPEEYSKGFEAFWALYPRRVGKAAASAAWERLTYEQQKRAYLSLKRQLRSLQGEMRSDGNFCPYPATWINQGRFDDDDGTPAAPQRKSFLDSVIVPDVMPRPADEVS